MTRFTLIRPLCLGTEYQEKQKEKQEQQGLLLAQQNAPH